MKNLKDIKTFSDASAAAVRDLLDAMRPDDQDRVAALFEAGNSLSLSHVVHPDGTTAVLFECLLADGTRKVLAHVAGRAPTIQ